MSTVKNKTDNRPLSNAERIAQFSAMNNADLREGTNTYFKFKSIGEEVVGVFLGIESINLDKSNPDKLSECAIVETEAGEKLLMAQTIVVNELRKKWDADQSVGFLCKIVFKGLEKAGTPDQYQKFSIYFEK